MAIAGNISERGKEAESDGRNMAGEREGEGEGECVGDDGGDATKVESGSGFGGNGGGSDFGVASIELGDGTTRGVLVRE